MGGNEADSAGGGAMLWALVVTVQSQRGERTRRRSVKTWSHSAPVTRQTPACISLEVNLEQLAAKAPGLGVFAAVSHSPAETGRRVANRQPQRQGGRKQNASHSRNRGPRAWPCLVALNTLRPAPFSGPRSDESPTLTCICCRWACCIGGSQLAIGSQEPVGQSN